MSAINAKDYLNKFGLDSKIIKFDKITATVKEAAEAIGTTEAQIAKTMGFDLGDKCILIVCAGDTKIDNSKFKQIFGRKAEMIKFDSVESKIGHKVGGVCPFGINDNVDVYLDKSLQRFDKSYLAAGDEFSVIGLSYDDLKFAAQKFVDEIDVCKFIGE